MYCHTDLETLDQQSINKLRKRSKAVTEPCDLVFFPYLYCVLHVHNQLTDSTVSIKHLLYGPILALIIDKVKYVPPVY